jgi:hypothetical protein
MLHFLPNPLKGESCPPVPSAHSVGGVQLMSDQLGRPLTLPAGGPGKGSALPLIRSSRVSSTTVTLSRLKSHQDPSDTFRYSEICY